MFHKFNQANVKKSICRIYRISSCSLDLWNEILWVLRTRTSKVAGNLDAFNIYILKWMKKLINKDKDINE